MDLNHSGPPATFEQISSYIDSFIGKLNIKIQSELKGAISDLKDQFQSQMSNLEKRLRYEFSYLLKDHEDQIDKMKQDLRRLQNTQDKLLTLKSAQSTQHSSSDKSPPAVSPPSPVQSDHLSEDPQLLTPEQSLQIKHLVTKQQEQQAILLQKSRDFFFWQHFSLQKHTQPPPVLVPRPTVSLPTGLPHTSSPPPRPQPPCSPDSG